MLASRHRITDAADFRRCLRGKRAAGSFVVVHVASQTDAELPVRVGFVVSKAVGPAVTRNLVKRRLRELIRERLGGISPGSAVVVRALPAAVGASYAELGRDLDAALGRTPAGRTGGAA